MTVGMVPKRDWRWSPRIYDLYVALNLPVVFDADYVYGGSSPGDQAYVPPFLGDPGHIRVDPSTTTADDLLHEVGHHLECLRDRPEDLLKRNWGLDDPLLDASTLLDGSEAMACDLEVGIRVLWHWPWHRRAQLLNLPEWWQGGWGDDVYPGHGKRLRALALDYLNHAGVQL
jgi:hypothetical protein